MRNLTRNTISLFDGCNISLILSADSLRSLTFPGSSIINVLLTEIIAQATCEAVSWAGNCTEDDPSDKIKSLQYWDYF